jgi:hypothetical protein
MGGSASIAVEHFLTVPVKPMGLVVMVDKRVVATLSYAEVKIAVAQYEAEQAAYDKAKGRR